MRDIAQWICDEATKRGARFCDVRIIRSNAEGIRVQDGRADRLASGYSYGMGVRVLAGRSWGFASADAVNRSQAAKCLAEALGLARASADFVAEDAETSELAPAEATLRAEPRIPPQAMPVKDKIKTLLECERAARRTGEGKIVNSFISYGDGLQEQLLVNTAGCVIRSENVRAVATAMVTASDGEILQRALEQKAIAGGAELLVDTAPEQLPVLAAEKVLGLLKAKKAPAGRFTVIFHPSITGLLVHEALGHNAEADAVWAGQSILEGKLGQMLAADDVTIVDDATRPGEFGSYSYDSEGVPAQKNTIIANGRLVGFLHSLETAKRFDVKPTGSARAQDYDCRPIPRMSNTFMVSGKRPFEEMIAPIDRGIYLKDGHWGYVYVQKGQFICHAGQAQMIEHGRLGEPLRDVSISSITLDTLKKIDAVGDDFEMDMPGMCGKMGQGAPTNAGGPHMRVRDIVVGGHGMT